MPDSQSEIRTMLENRPQTRAANGHRNWLGLKTLYLREVRRFSNVYIQTVLAPVITTLIFLTIFALAIGRLRGDINGISFIQFLAPGLIMMAILQNAFANTSVSLIQSKLNLNIIDTLMPPLSPMELTVGFVLGGATRGLMVAIGVGVSLAFIIPIQIHSVGAIVFYAVGAALMMGSMGMMTGIWAEKFDHVSTVTNFVILPLSFLSGTFFPITRFPEILQTVSHFNPFFYLIDGFRFGFIGYHDGSLMAGIMVVLGVNIALWIACQRMFSSGYKLKS